MSSNDLELAEAHYRELCERIQQALDKLKSNDEQKKNLEAQLRQVSEEESKQRTRLKTLKDRIDVTNTSNSKAKLAVKRAATDYDSLVSILQYLNRQIARINKYLFILLINYYLFLVFIFSPTLENKENKENKNLLFFVFILLIH